MGYGSMLVIYKNRRLGFDHQSEAPLYRATVDYERMTYGCAYEGVVDRGIDLATPALCQ